ncbi:hypothetical protein Enr8_23080 [Blastopirellula retiformator]|uniref:Uncharacterized protein n=1 Tax=Blastopirellula retiformator TaxID=2527970 RepID=A0A5C5VAA2_9BACT|nr:hypothetical protein Enr8_23080 [Blastopirellula retiformator]
MRPLFLLFVLLVPLGCNKAEPYGNAPTAVGAAADQRQDNPEYSPDLP